MPAHTRFRPDRLSRRRLSRRRIVPVALAFVLAVGTLLYGAPAASLVAQELPTAAPAALLPGQAELRLNEFMASNDNFHVDPSDPGAAPDWIEIYNPTGQDVNMKGLAITDEAVVEPLKNPITLDVIVPAGGFLLLFADNGEDGGLHLNFAISAGGEHLGLFGTDTGGQPVKIDEREFGAQEADVSEGRRPDGSGDWVTFTAPTPGQSNETDGPQIANLQRSVAQPQASDTVTVTVEISDPNGSIAEATLLYSTTTQSLTQLPLTLASGNTYQAVLPARPDGTYVRYSVYAKDNDDNDAQSVASGYVVGYVPPVLVINEFVADPVSGQGVRDEDDPTEEYPDWMELYNPGDTAVSLNGLFLSDNPEDPARYAIPNGFSIPAKGYLLIYLDDDEEQTAPPNSHIHTNFNLSKDGEHLGLYGAFGTAVVDATDFGAQIPLVSWGRYPDGTGDFQFLVCTTPGAANRFCAPRAYLPHTQQP